MAQQQIPETFYNVINDFIIDINNTFPEYQYLLKKVWNTDYSDCFLNITDEVLRQEKIEQDKKDQLTYLFKHCMKVFPERFFDILYENEDMFKEDSTINTEFLPRIVFRHLWNSGISEKTKQTIWKYLQLILITIIGSVENKNCLGDTAKLFENINEDDLKTKLQDTLNNIQSIFETRQQDTTDEGATEQKQEQEQGQEHQPPRFDFEGIQQNFSNIINGKLGKMAMELVEETTNELTMDESNINSTGDIFNQMFKNPGKLMNMIKKVGDKIDTKIKNGEINETEIMSEGMDILNKMKDTGGMQNIQQLFSQMGMNVPTGMSGKQKINTNAMRSKMMQNMKNSKIKDRIRQRNAGRGGNGNNDGTGGGKGTV